MLVTKCDKQTQYRYRYSQPDHCHNVSHTIKILVLMLVSPSKILVTMLLFTPLKNVRQNIKSQCYSHNIKSHYPVKSEDGWCKQTWHFGTFRGRVYLGWNYNTFKSHRDRAGTEGVIEITLETG